MQGRRGACVVVRSIRLFEASFGGGLYCAYVARVMDGRCPVAAGLGAPAFRAWPC